VAPCPLPASLRGAPNCLQSSFFHFFCNALFVSSVGPGPPHGTPSSAVPRQACACDRSLVPLPILSCNPRGSGGPTLRDTVRLPTGQLLRFFSLSGPMGGCCTFRHFPPELTCLSSPSFLQFFLSRQFLQCPPGISFYSRFPLPALSGGFSALCRAVQLRTQASVFSPCCERLTG